MAIPLPVDQTRNLTLATRTPRGGGLKLLWRLRRTAKMANALSYGGALRGRMLMLADIKGASADSDQRESSQN
jgi:3-oxosteroid 1-dehydrogenase